MRRIRFSGVKIDLENARIDRSINRNVKERIIQFFANNDVNKLIETVLHDKDIFDSWSAPFVVTPEAAAIQDALKEIAGDFAETVRTAFSGMKHDDAVAVAVYAQSIPVFTARNIIFNMGELADTNLFTVANPAGSPYLHRHNLGLLMRSNASNMHVNKVREYLSGLDGSLSKENSWTAMAEEIARKVEAKDRDGIEFIREWSYNVIPKDTREPVTKGVINTMSALFGLDKDRLEYWAINDREGFRRLFNAVNVNSTLFYRTTNMRVDALSDNLYKYALGPSSDGKHMGFFNRLAQADLIYSSGISFMYNSVTGKSTPASRMLSHFREMFLRMPGKTVDDFSVLTGIQNAANKKSSDTVHPNDVLRAAYEFFNKNEKSSGKTDKYWFTGMPVGDKFVMPMYLSDKHTVEELIGPDGLYAKAWNEFVERQKNVPGFDLAHLEKMYGTPEAFDEHVKNGKNSHKELENFDAFLANYAYNRLLLDEYIMGSPFDYTSDTDQFKRSSNLGTPYLRPVLNMEGGWGDESKVLILNIPLDAEGNEVGVEDDGSTYTTASGMEKESISYGSRIKSDLPGQLKMSTSMIVKENNVNRRINIKALLNLAAEGLVAPEIVKIANAVDEYNESHPDNEIRFFSDTNSTKERFTKSKAVPIWTARDGKKVVNDVVLRQFVNGEFDDYLVTVDNKSMGLINEQDYNPVPHDRSMLKQYFAVVGQFDPAGVIANNANRMVRAAADRAASSEYLYEKLLDALYKNRPRVAEMVEAGVTLHNPLVSNIVYEMMSGVARKAIRPIQNGLLTSELGDVGGEVRASEIITDVNGKQHVRLNEVIVGGLNLREDEEFSSREEAMRAPTNKKLRERYPEFYPLKENGLPDYSDTSIVESSVYEILTEEGKIKFVFPGEVTSGRRNPDSVASSNVLGTVKRSRIKGKDANNVTSFTIPELIRLARGSDGDGDWDHVHVFYRQDDKVILMTEAEEDAAISAALNDGYGRKTIGEYKRAMKSMSNKILLKEVQINRDPANQERLNEVVNPTRWKHLSEEIKQKGNAFTKFDYDYKNLDGSRPANFFGTYMYHRVRSGITGTHKVGFAAKSTMSMIYALQDWNAETPFVSLNYAETKLQSDKERYDLVISRLDEDSESFKHASRDVVKAAFDIVNAVLDDTKNDQALDLGLDAVPFVIFLLSHNPNLGRNADGSLASKAVVEKNIDTYMADIVHFMNSPMMIRYRKELVNYNGVFAEDGDLYLYIGDGSARGKMASSKYELQKLFTSKPENFDDMVVKASSPERKAYAKTYRAFVGSEKEESEEIKFLDLLIAASKKLTGAGFVQEIYDERIKTPYDIKQAVDSFSGLIDTDGTKLYDFTPILNSAHYGRAKTAAELYERIIPDSGLYDSKNIKDLYYYANGKSSRNMNGADWDKSINAIASAGMTAEGLKQLGADNRAELFVDLSNIFRTNEDLMNSIFRWATTIESVEADVDYVVLDKGISLGLTEADVDIFVREVARIEDMDNLGGKYIKTGKDLLLAMVVAGPLEKPITGTYRTAGMLPFMSPNFNGKVIEPLYQRFLSGIAKEQEYDGKRNDYFRLRSTAARMISKESVSRVAMMPSHTYDEREAQSVEVDKILSEAPQAIIALDDERKGLDVYSNIVKSLYSGATGLYDSDLSEDVFVILPMSKGFMDKDRAYKLFGQLGYKMSLAIRAGQNLKINLDNIQRLHSYGAKNQEMLNHMWETCLESLISENINVDFLPRSGVALNDFAGLEDSVATMSEDGKSITIYGVLITNPMVKDEDGNFVPLEDTLPVTKSPVRDGALEVVTEEDTYSIAPSGDGVGMNATINGGVILSAPNRKELLVLIKDDARRRAENPQKASTFSMAMAQMYLPLDMYGDERSQKVPVMKQDSGEIRDVPDMAGVIAAFKNAGYKIRNDSGTNYVDPYMRLLGLSPQSNDAIFKLAARVTAQGMNGIHRMRKIFSKSKSGSNINAKEVMEEMLVDSMLADTDSWKDLATDEMIGMIDRMKTDIMSGSGKYIDSVYTASIYNAENFSMRNYAKDKAQQKSIEETYFPTDPRTPKEIENGVLMGMDEDTRAARSTVLDVIDKSEGLRATMDTLLAHGYPTARRILSRKIGGNKYEFGVMAAGGVRFLITKSNGIYNALPASIDSLKQQVGTTQSQSISIMDAAWKTEVFTHPYTSVDKKFESLIAGYAGALRRKYISNGWPSGSADVSARKNAEQWAEDFKSMNDYQAKAQIMKLPEYLRAKARKVFKKRAEMNAGVNDSPLKTREQLDSASLDMAMDVFAKLPNNIIGGSDALHSAYKGIVRAADADHTIARGWKHKFMLAVGAASYNPPTLWNPGEYSFDDPSNGKNWILVNKGELVGSFEKKSEAKAEHKRLKKLRYISTPEEESVSYKMRMAAQAIIDGLRGAAIDGPDFEKNLVSALDTHIYLDHEYTDKPIAEKIDESVALYTGMLNSNKADDEGNLVYAKTISPSQLRMIMYLVDEGHLNADMANRLLDKIRKTTETTYAPLIEKGNEDAAAAYASSLIKLAASVRPDLADQWSYISRTQASYLILKGLERWNKKEPNHVFRERKIKRLTDDGPLVVRDIDLYWEDYIYNNPKGREYKSKLFEMAKKAQTFGHSTALHTFFNEPYFGLSEEKVLSLLSDAGYQHAVTSGEIVDEYDSIRINPDGSKTKFGENTKSLKDVLKIGIGMHTWFREATNRPMREAGIAEEWLRSYGGVEGGAYVSHRSRVDTPEDEKTMDLLLSRVSRYKEATRHTNERVLYTFEDMADFGLVSISPLLDETFNGYVNEVITTRKNILTLSQGAMAQDSGLQPEWVMQFNEDTRYDKVMDDVVPNAFNNVVVRHMLANLAMFVNYNRRSRGEKEYFIDLSADPRTEYNKLVRNIETEGMHKYGLEHVELKVSPFKSISKYYVKNDGKAEKILRHIVTLPVGSYIDPEGRLQQRTSAKVVDAINNWGKDIGIATTSSFAVDDKGKFRFNLGVLGIRSIPLLPRTFKPHQFRWNVPFSLFHAFSLIESFRAFMGVTTMDSSFIKNGGKYIKTLYNYKKLIEDNPEVTERYMNAGLTASFNPPDVDFGLVSRHINWLRENSSGFVANAMDQWNKERAETRKWLWQGIHPAMKMFCFDKATEEIARKEQKKADKTGRAPLSQDFIDQSVARMVNNAFGGQRWEEYLWANPRRRHAATLLMFALDWCCDEKTRAMTKDGFKYYHELKIGDEIMGFDKDTKELRWMPLNDLYSRDNYNGNMINIKNYNKNLMMTDEHTCYVVHDKSRKSSVIKAKELNSHHLIPRCAPMSLTKKETLDDAFIKTIGWMVTDGSYAYSGWRTLKDGAKKRTKFGRISQNKERGIKELDTLGLKYYTVDKSKGCHDNFVCNRDVKVYTVPVSVIKKMESIGIKDKSLSWEFLSLLSERQLLMLKNTMHLADGTGQNRFCGTEESIFNMTLIQTMLGQPTTFYQQEENCWRTRTISSKYISCKGHNDNLSEVYYDGTIWCPSVDTGFWLAEKDGALFITGNTLSAANISGLTALPGLRNILDTRTNAIEGKWMATKYWPAMFAVVMTGIPMLMQGIITGIAKGVGGDDDDDYKWLTLNNEDGKNGWHLPFWDIPTGIAAHVDITPIAKSLPGPFKYKGGPPGDRHLYVRWAKQATEVFEGWFAAPIQTALSKTSVSVKIALEQTFGRSISIKNSFPLDFNGQPLFTGFIKGEDDGFFGSRTGYIARKFIPMTLTSVLEGRPTMATLQFAPMSKGLSKYAIQQKMEQTLDAYADAGQYKMLQAQPESLRSLAAINKKLVDVAIVNGFDPREVLVSARSSVLRRYYDDFFKAIEGNKMDDAIEAADSIRRLGRNFENLKESITRKYGDNPELLTDEIKQRVYDAYMGKGR